MMANVGERWRTTRGNVKYAADDGERPRTLANNRATGLKTARVQALVGSNPTPSAPGSKARHSSRSTPPRNAGAPSTHPTSSVECQFMALRTGADVVSPTRSGRFPSELLRLQELWGQ